MKKYFLLLILIMTVLASTVFAAPKVNDLLKAIDTITELKTDGTAQVTMTQQKDKEGVKVWDSIYYRRDKDDSFLIVFTAPESEKGNGYLKHGDNMWMYKRNTRTFQHINRDESIAGSDVKAEDLENKKLTDLYQPVVDKSGKEILTETKLGDVPVYQFEVKSKIENVAYPKRIYWIRKDNYLPLKIQSFSLNGTLMQTAYFLKYTQIQGKYLFVKGMFIDEFEKTKTIVEIKNISVRKIEDHIFTKAYLENLSK